MVLIIVLIMVLLAIRLSHLLIHLLIMQPNLHIIMQELLIPITTIQVRLNLWNDILPVAWIVTSKLDLSWYHYINIPKHENCLFYSKFFAFYLLLSKR